MSREKGFDVTVVGGAGFDTNCYLYSNSIDYDREVNFTVNKDGIGGSGGYSSLSFANLGLQTAFIGAVGDDIFGKKIRTIFDENDINIAGIIHDPQGTKRSVNLIYNDGTRKNFYDAKGAFDIKVDIQSSKTILSQSKLAHFSVVNWTRELLPIAKKLGVKISTDIQDVVEVDDEYRIDYLKYSDIIFFSAVNVKNPIEFIDEYLQQYPNIELVIVGNGDKGCIVGSKYEIKHYPPIKFSAKVTDSNGAGDSLATGFLSSYLFHNYDLTTSITRAQINARYTCTLNSVPEKMLNFSQLNQFYNEYRISSEIVFETMDDK